MDWRKEAESHFLSHPEFSSLDSVLDFAREYINKEKEEREKEAGARKVVINVCYGGFAVSDDAIKRMRELGCKEAEKETLLGETYPDNSGVCEYADSSRNIERDCPILIRVVEEMGKAANGRYAELKVIEIPGNVQWEVEEYDGREWIAEKHRTW